MAQREILFFTHDSLYSARVFERLLHTPGLTIKAVVLSQCVIERGGSVVRDSLRIVKRSGFKYALYQALVTSGYPFLRGRFRQTRLSQLAKSAGIPILRTSNVNTEDTRQSLHRLGCDQAVSCYFNQLFKPTVIALFPGGIINLHPSLLPHNRGVDPMFFARLRDESMGGVSLHYIDETLDTGPIIAQANVELDNHQSLISQQLTVFEQGPHYCSTTSPQSRDSSPYLRM